jgi:WbqC-like protein family
MRVVVSQSMYFPWVGLLEQVRLADVFVHYDDVQLTRGFYNRVQVKTASGSRWITVPLRDHHRGQLIHEVLVDDRVDWRSQHRDVLRQALKSAPFVSEMLALVDEVFNQKATTLSEVSCASMLALARYFGLDARTRFESSVGLNLPGRSSQRLCDIVRHLGGTQYITGHGALQYLDHALFERAGIGVRYMDYQRRPYPQCHGEFTPYVTALDLVAQMGREGARLIVSESVDWRSFTHEPA